MKNCIFCKIINKEIPSHILYEDEVCIAFLDLSQTTKGHTLIIPKKHSTNILDVDEEISAYLFKIATLFSKKIQKNLNASGINILSNANEVAGQTVNHFHIHIIPRYNNDSGIKIEFTNNHGKYDLLELVQDINQ